MSVYFRFSQEDNGRMDFMFSMLYVTHVHFLLEVFCEGPTWQGPVGPRTLCFWVCCELRHGCQSLSRDEGSPTESPREGVGPHPATRKHGPLDKFNHLSEL